MMYKIISVTKNKEPITWFDFHQTQGFLNVFMSVIQEYLNSNDLLKVMVTARWFKDLLESEKFWETYREQSFCRLLGKILPKDIMEMEPSWKGGKIVNKWKSFKIFDDWSDYKWVKYRYDDFERVGDIKNFCGGYQIVLSLFSSPAGNNNKDIVVDICKLYSSFNIPGIAVAIVKNFSSGHGFDIGDEGVVEVGKTLVRNGQVIEALQLPKLTGGYPRLYKKYFLNSEKIIGFAINHVFDTRMAKRGKFSEIKTIIERVLVIAEDFLDKEAFSRVDKTIRVVLKPINLLTYYKQAELANRLMNPINALNDSLNEKKRIQKRR